MNNVHIRTYTEPKYPHYHRVAAAIKDVLPKNAIIMTRNPWELLFYSRKDIKAVGLPYAPPRILLAVAKYYNVTHLMVERRRPGMREFLYSNHPALTKIIHRPQAVYAIDFTKFKEDEIAEISELEGFNRKLKARN